MSEELQALENIRREAGTPRFSSLYDIDDWKDDFNTILYALKRLEKYDNSTCNGLMNENIKLKKVLEIIKNKISWDFAIKYWWENHEINDEEKDLLKEVLL